MGTGSLHDELKGKAGAWFWSALENSLGSLGRPMTSVVHVNDGCELFEETSELLGYEHRCFSTQDAIDGKLEGSDEQEEGGCTDKLSRFWTVAGPGLVVMLADTDCGSLITAAQSGAQWGYSLVSLQVVLIPILYLTKNLTVRLGVLTGQGHGELIRDTFGAGWAWLSVSTLVVACAGGIVSQMSGIVQVGQLIHIPDWLSVLFTVVFLLTVVLTGSYRSIERIALLVGAFELVFLITMFASPVDFSSAGGQLFMVPTESNCFHTSSRCASDYLQIWTANLGAVIMPWMIFYHQSAVVDKGLKPEDLNLASWDTLVGSIITQVVMASVVITTAANLWSGSLGDDSNQYEDISDVTSALVASKLGEKIGPQLLQVMLAMGILGASLVASIVVSLTAAWGLGEVAGYERTLEKNAAEAPWFYAVFGGLLITGAVFTLSPLNSVGLNVGIQIMNAALLPVVLGFLFLLAIRIENEDDRLRGAHMWVVGIVFSICSLLGVVGSGLALVDLFSR